MYKYCVVFSLICSLEDFRPPVWVFSLLCIEFVQCLAQSEGIRLMWMTLITVSVGDKSLLKLLKLFGTVSAVVIHILKKCQKTWHFRHFCKQSTCYHWAVCSVNFWRRWSLSSQTSMSTRSAHLSRGQRTRMCETSIYLLYAFVLHKPRKVCLQAAICDKFPLPRPPS